MSTIGGSTHISVMRLASITAVDGDWSGTKVGANVFEDIE
jgi:hypothetical protein